MERPAHRPRIGRFYPVIDAAHVEDVARFWAAVLDGEVTQADAEHHDWRDVTVDGAVVLGIQRAADHVPPTWPDASVPQQMHLDLYVERDRVEATGRHLQELGARALDTSRSPETIGHGFRVYADPADHPFCICWD